jgi:L-2-hydroxyglutarate oxidase LhgO
VIHAGIYYPTGSLKARLCVAGRDALYRYCALHGVAHRRIGKLIVATDPQQMATLEALHAQAEANGVGDLVALDGDAARRLEPNLVTAIAALHSPSTGIIDSHGLMLAYQGEAEDHGAMIAFNAPVEGGRVDKDRIVLQVGGPEPAEIAARIVVNAAGLGAQGVARALAGLDPTTVPPLHYAKGNYFQLQARPPFGRLIYPVPEPGGLGVHLTLDLGGRCRFGPDVEWVERIDYAVDPRRGDRFYAAIRRYWPGLRDGALAPDYCGIRPKLGPAGSPNADFVIQGPAAHGVPGLVNLYGIESPGLTASLAIADEVLARLASG